MQQAIIRSIKNGHSGMTAAARRSEAVRPDQQQVRDVPQPDAATSEDASQKAEKRSDPRDPAQDLSEIILPGQKHGIACMIRDISVSGAKLEVSCGDLPARFVLANYTKRTKTICRQIWRNNRLVGVQFLSKPRAFTLKEGL